MRRVFLKVFSCERTDRDRDGHVGERRESHSSSSSTRTIVKSLSGTYIGIGLAFISLQ
jgi:hypothetical protein